MKAVATHGMKGVSTRSISGEAGINDAYIYRIFKDKEDLLMHAYFMENEKFLQTVGIHVRELLADDRLGPIERCESGYRFAWRYLIDNPDVCRFFAYYYHSPNYRECAKDEQWEQMKVISGQIAHIFPEDKDAHVLLYVLLIVLTTLALRVVDGDLPDDEETWSIVLDLLHGLLATHTRIPARKRPSQTDQGEVVT